MLGICILLQGCATGTYRPIRGDRDASSVYTRRDKGVTHKVRAGETIWRIAKTYHVSIKDIIRANNMPDVAHIEVGQLIFIPHAQTVKDIPAYKDDSNPNEFSWPLKGRVISYFGQETARGVNRGIDIKARDGDIVYASRKGKVVFADNLSGYAYTVVLDHYDGYFTVYSQNAALLVRLGDRIDKGIPIAEVGKNRSLAYLHFEIRENDKANNPLHYLP